MSTIFLWVGLTMMLALPQVLGIFGVPGAEIFEVVGAISMVVGAIMLCFKK